MILGDAFIFIFSLSGILLGLALSCIAAEELKEGKKGRKYLWWLKRGLFAIICLTVNYYLLNNALMNKIFLLIIFNLAAVILFLLSWNKLRLPVEISSYLLWGAYYFLYSEQEFNLILASLIFLYGFPLGSLLKK